MCTLLLVCADAGAYRSASGVSGLSDDYLCTEQTSLILHGGYGSKFGGSGSNNNPAAALHQQQLKQLHHHQQHLRQEHAALTLPQQLQQQQLVLAAETLDDVSK